MAGPITQTGRLIAIKTPLGADKMLLRSFHATEAISSLFSIVADVMTLLEDAPKVKAEALVGHSVTITVSLETGAFRYFHGMVRRLIQTGREERFAYFRLEIVPELWRLENVTDCRIYQEKTVPDIVQGLLQEFGFGHVRLSLKKTYTAWDYCVQYRETYVAFISRILEHEGIFFFFEHTDGKHTLVIADDPSEHHPCPAMSQARYQPEAGPGDPQSERSVIEWETSEELRPGKLALRDYNFQIPTQQLEVSESSVVNIGQNQNLEVFDYPGGYSALFSKPDSRLGEVNREGEKVARLRMEEEEAIHHVASGGSLCMTFTAGYRFTLTQHFQPAFNQAYVLDRVEHHAVQSPSYDTNEEPHQPYQNRFQAIPHTVPYRPRRVHPRPVIEGPQSARVVGPHGEEIYVDKYGRVKVQFHWDRRGQHDEKSSCWVRVATPIAGAGWGMVHLPRINQEVLVNFLDGDLNQPIIMGSLYNAANMPPYTLPANKTQSGYKTRSSLNGGADNCNEIRFEDKKGSEELLIHAEKTLTTSVEASESHTVGGDRSTTIHQKDTLLVEKGNLEITVQEKDMITKVDKGNIEVKAPLGSATLDAKSIKQTATTTYEIIATASVKITCGASSIVLTPASITITSPVIKLNC